MPKAEKVLYVCKRCGAVGSVKQPHCILCGANLDKTMQLRPGEHTVKVDRNEEGRRCMAESEKNPFTLLGLLAAAFGAASALSLMLPVASSGFLAGMVAIIFAIVALVKNKGGKILSLMGLVLGGYAVFVNVFYSIWKFIYLFID